MTRPRSRSIDTSHTGAPEDWSFAHRWTRSAVFDPELSIPVHDIDFTEKPSRTNAAEWDRVAYERPGVMSVRRARFSLTFQQTASGPQSEEAMHLWPVTPFAVYRADVSTAGQGEHVSVLLDFRSGDGAERLSFSYVRAHSTTEAVGTVGATYSVDGVSKVHKRWDAAIDSDAFSLLVQLHGGRAASVWAVSGGAEPHYIGRVDLADHLDLRDPRRATGWTFGVGLRGSVGAIAKFAHVSTSIGGCGLADPRIVTFEDGTPIQVRDRVWVTMTTRGDRIEDAFEGVYVLHVPTGRLEMTGAIFFDRGDGVQHNDNAAEVFFDRTAGVWRAVATGHSDFGEGHRAVWGATFDRDPRAGIVTAPAAVIEMPQSRAGDFFEDTDVVWDAAAGRWAATASKNANASARLEAERWDGPYTSIAPARKNGETGNVFVRSGGVTHVLAGTEDGGYVVRDFVTHAVRGHLTVDEPTGGERVWPVAFPFRSRAEGVTWKLLSFDRVSLAGPHSYGRLHFYEQVR